MIVDDEIEDEVNEDIRLPGWEAVPFSSPETSDDENANDIFAPIGQEDSYDQEGRAALHPRKDIIPIYDVNRSIPGHFIWNKGYGVLRRRMHLHGNVQVNAMLQHMVSITDNPCVSLLYPEGQLFPRIFWSSQDSSVVGSIPSFMLNCFFDKTDFGITSLQEHNAIRMKDADIITSKQHGYWHYLFDLILNQQLNRCSSSLVLKRGLEFLLENDCGTNSSSEWHGTESKLPMDEAEATRRVKELACLLKKGSWTYFITLTINETETPGVRKITEAIKEYAERDLH